MSQPIASFSNAVAISKSNTVNFDASVSTSGQNVKPCDAIYVGGAGVVVAVLQNGVLATFTAVAGQILPISAIRVNNTNTTATSMVALYQV